MRARSSASTRKNKVVKKCLQFVALLNLFAGHFAGEWELWWRSAVGFAHRQHPGASGIWSGWRGSSLHSSHSSPSFDRTKGIPRLICLAVRCIHLRVNHLRTHIHPLPPAHLVPARPRPHETGALGWLTLFVRQALMSSGSDNEIKFPWSMGQSKRHWLNITHGIVWDDCLCFL